MSKKFEYKYSAPTEQERKEIEYIRNQYLEADESIGKLKTLRSLDNKVKNLPTILALVVGIIGILIFGLGLTMILEWKLIWGGVIVAIFGVVPMAVNYLIFKKVSKLLRNKYKDIILKLSGEILNEEGTKEL